MNSPVGEGQTIAGKYRIDRVIGVGGMGVVMAAHHLELDSRVAIKFLLPETASNSEAVARFAREARAAVMITSEHVTRTSDIGKLDDGTPYIVMEYLEGSDLAAWLIQYGPLPLEQAVEFVLQAGEAIAEAHALGIVHRDLKPSNLFVTHRGGDELSIKVLDFGISKTGDAGPSMTRTAVMVGSPMYMSPEQVRSARDVDQQTDIWALGVILYELITGVPPFDGDDLTELVNRILSESPRSIRSYRPSVPEALERVIFRCLTRDLEQRFGSMAELADALLPFAPRRALASVERISGIRSLNQTLQASIDVTVPSFAPSLPAPTPTLGSPLSPAPLPALPALPAFGAPTTFASPVTPPLGSARVDGADRAGRNRWARVILAAAAALVAALALLVGFDGMRRKPASEANAIPAASHAPAALRSAAPATAAPVVEAKAPVAPLVVTLGAAIPDASSAAAPPTVARPRAPAPIPSPPPAKAEPAHPDPFDSDSWGRFRR